MNEAGSKFPAFILLLPMFQGSAVPSAAKLHQRQNLRQFYRCRQEGVGVFRIFIIEDILEDFAAAMQRNGNALRLTITDRRNINLNTYTYEKKTIMRNSRFSIHYRFDLLRCRPNL